MKRDKNNSPHYTWGAQCDGWHLLQSENLSVIQERMPPDSSETRHYHETSMQLFFVLSGQLSIEIDEKLSVLYAHESVEVPARSKHRVWNESHDNVEFLVISQPTTRNDRVNLTEAHRLEIPLVNKTFVPKI